MSKRNFYFDTEGVLSFFTSVYKVFSVIDLKLHFEPL